MWRIGDLRIDGRVVLAPMSGYTFESYREFMRPFGVSLSFTEMTSSMGLRYGEPRTGRYVEYERTHPTGVQLSGSDPDTMAVAARKALEINPSIDLIDVNMGCPAQKIIRNGAGSALMRDPRLCGDIVRAIKKAVDVPVTAKMRLGWSGSEIDFRQVLDEVVSAGADAVTVHPRTRAERYGGEPHYDLVRGLRSDLPVPLMISGNIYSAEDAKKALEITGADAVMVARGALGNPYMVTQTAALLRDGERLPDPTVDTQIGWCLEFARRAVDEFGEEAGCRKLRSIAPRFLGGIRFSKPCRLEIVNRMETLSDLEGIVAPLRERHGEERIFMSGDPVGIRAIRCPEKCEWLDGRALIL